MNNWRTTAAGYIAATLQLWAGGMTIKNAAAAAGLALIGTLAKDHNVTGVGPAATTEPT